MPHDQRRINGPESSVAYRFHSKINLKTYEEKLKDTFNTNGKRVDGRKLTEARKICKDNLKLSYCNFTLTCNVFSHQIRCRVTGQRISIH